MKKNLRLLILLFLAYLFGITTKEFIKDNLYEPFRKGQIIGLRNIISCPLNSIQIAYFGQSNASNFVKPKISLNLPPNIFQYDWKTKKCFKYKEPLIGADGKYGNVITYTALKISENTEKPILIIPFGKNNSSVLEWAYLKLHKHHMQVLNNIKESNLNPNIFLWHQGENDSQFITKKSIYKDALQLVIKRTNDYFPESFFGIAIASKCKKYESNLIREAQIETTELNKNIFISANSDEIVGKSLRYDGCHFNAEGANILGEKYYESIKNFLFK